MSKRVLSRNAQRALDAFDNARDRVNLALARELSPGTRVLFSKGNMVAPREAEVVWARCWGSHPEIAVLNLETGKARLLCLDDITRIVPRREHDDL